MIFDSCKLVMFLFLISAKNKKDEVKGVKDKPKEKGVEKQGDTKLTKDRGISTNSCSFFLHAMRNPTILRCSSL